MCGRVATVGLVRLVRAMTGSSTSGGSSGIFGRWHVRQPQWLGLDPFGNRYRKRKAAGRLGGGRSVGYLVAPNGLLLRQCRLYRLVLVGIVSRWACGGPISRDDTVVQPQGWFVGGGVENNLDIFGISAPGWFMKTEYRAAYYDQQNVPETIIGWYRRVPRLSLQAFGGDRQHLAGLSLQLDRSGGRQVLIRMY